MPGEVECLYGFNLLHNVGVVAERVAHEGDDNTPSGRKLEKLTVVKLTTEILINTDIYAYSETTFGGPTIVYGMTEN